MNNHEKLLRKNIGKKIKLARTNANFTQEQLAEKISLSTEDSCEFNDLIDAKFLKSYSKLNNYNRNILNSMASELLKLQDAESMNYKDA